MEPSVHVITDEIASKGKGYLLVKRCGPDKLGAVLADCLSKLRSAGAVECYVACTDPDTQLREGTLGSCHLTYVHDILGMYRDLTPDRPHPQGRLILEPLTRETGTDYLAIYNTSFHHTPNSVTYGEEALEQLFTEQYRCGFALLDGVRVGIYEVGFKKESPEIGSIGLTSEAQGKGLGRELLLNVMDLVAGLGYAKCWLQVSTANKNAYSLYHWAGFYLDRVLSHWYGITERDQ